MVGKAFLKNGIFVSRGYGGSHSSGGLAHYGLMRLYINQCNSQSIYHIPLVQHVTTSTKINKSKCTYVHTYICVCSFQYSTNTRNSTLMFFFFWLWFISDPWFKHTLLQVVKNLSLVTRWGCSSVCVVDRFRDSSSVIGGRRLPKSMTLLDTCTGLLWLPLSHLCKIPAARHVNLCMTLFSDWNHFCVFQ